MIYTEGLGVQGGTDSQGLQVIRLDSLMWERYAGTLHLSLGT